jgi:hypothetical protein
MRSEILGDRQRFTASSLTLPGVTRTFQAFPDAAEENGLSRLYACIHFRHAVSAGRRQGRSIGQAVESTQTDPTATITAVRNWVKPPAAPEHYLQEVLSARLDGTSVWKISRPAMGRQRRQPTPKVRVDGAKRAPSRVRPSRAKLERAVHASQVAAEWSRIAPLWRLMPPDPTVSVIDGFRQPDDTLPRSIGRPAKAQQPRK